MNKLWLLALSITALAVVACAPKAPDESASTPELATGMEATAPPTGPGDTGMPAPTAAPVEGTTTTAPAPGETTPAPMPGAETGTTPAPDATTGAPDAGTESAPAGDAGAAPAAPGTTN